MRSTSRSSLVTVTIPTRNRADHLAKTLDSILNSTVLPDRIFVVDNSTDGHQATKTLCERYGDDVTYVAPTADLSMAANHNRCLDLIDTELGCVLHDDDVFGPDFLERGIAELGAHPDAVFFAVNYGVIDEVGTELYPHAWPKFPAGQLSPREFLTTAFATHSPVHFSASLLRADPARRCRLSDRDANCADMGYFFQLATYGSVLLCQDGLVQVRVHADMESARAGYHGFRGNRRSEALAFVPVEWGTKRRFLVSDRAAAALGSTRPAVRRAAAKAAVRALAHDLRIPTLALNERARLVLAAVAIGWQAIPNQYQRSKAIAA